MKILLRNTENGLFYAGPEEWTEDLGRALEFERADLAADCAAETKGRQLEVLMHFEDPAFEIPLRIVEAPQQ
jgi:hypothetical protein